MADFPYQPVQDIFHRINSSYWGYHISILHHYISDLNIHILSSFRVVQPFVAFFFCRGEIACPIERVYFFKLDPQCPNAPWDVMGCQNHLSYFFFATCFKAPGVSLQGYGVSWEGSGALGCSKPPTFLALANRFF